MSSNPLGDAFYDEDDLSITGSESAVKPDPAFDASSQPYLQSPPPPKPLQDEKAFSSSASVQRYEPDDRYVQPERKSRPAQSASLQQATPPEPFATASASSGPVTKNFGRTPALPAVIVTKTRPGQSKLSKARAAARRAAATTTTTSAAVKLPETKPRHTSLAANKPSEQTALETNAARPCFEDQSGNAKAPKPTDPDISKAKLRPRKPTAKPIDAIPEAPVVKSTEPKSAELTEDHSKPELVVRRAKDKARLSSADKMRAQRGMRALKANR